MEQVQLKSLIFNSYEDHAELVVEIRKESLSYLTTYVIDVLNINRVLNLIQKNNTELDLYESIQQNDYSDFQEFTLDFETINNTSIDKYEIDFMIVNSLKKQIRA
jgi:hypothetical protein